MKRVQRDRTPLVVRTRSHPWVEAVIWFVVLAPTALGIGAVSAACATALQSTPIQSRSNEAVAATARGPDRSVGEPRPSPDDAFRLQPPAPAARAPYVFPKVHESRLPSGMRLLVLEQRAIPVVAASLIACGGAAGFPAIAPDTFASMEHPGLLQSFKRGADSVASLLEKSSIALSSHSAPDFVSVGLRSSSGSFDSALDLLAHVLVRPSSFDSDLFALFRNRLTAFATIEVEDQSRLVRDVLLSALYGESHPYARSVRGLADGTAPTGEELLQAWRATIAPRNATLIVVGDVDPVSVAARAGTLFADWAPDPAWHAPAPPARASPGAARIVLVDRRGTGHAVIAYGGVVAPYDSPQFIADIALREILGGMKTSDLDRAFRDTLGREPRESADLTPLRAGSAYWWQGDVAPEEAARTLETLATQLGRLRAQGPSSSELAEVKERLGWTLPRPFQSVAGALEALAPAGCGVSLDDLASRQDRVQDLTADDVRVAVPSPDSMKAVVVGDARSLLSSLQALGWGPVEEVRDPVALRRTADPSGNASGTP